MTKKNLATLVASFTILLSTSCSAYAAYQRLPFLSPTTIGELREQGARTDESRARAEAIRRGEANSMAMQQSLQNEAMNRQYAMQEEIAEMRQLVEEMKSEREAFYAKHNR